MDSDYRSGDGGTDPAATPGFDASGNQTDPIGRTDVAPGTAGSGSELSTADIASASAPTMVDERSSTAGRDGGSIGSDTRTADASIGSTASTPPTGRGPSSDPASTAPAPTPSASGSTDGQDNPALFPQGEANSFRQRWTDLQAGFVDEPRQAVSQADGLVAEVIQKLASSFADERSKLEHQWDSGGDVSTEDLRQALRRYRSFFDRLLSM